MMLSFYSLDSEEAGAADFGNTNLSRPCVTLADTMISSSLISRRKSAPSTTYPKLQQQIIIQSKAKQKKLGLSLHLFKT